MVQGIAEAWAGAMKLNSGGLVPGTPEAWVWPMRVYLLKAVPRDARGPGQGDESNIWGAC